MSHELRTPLNSLLILARDLAENGEGNLTIDQVDSARVILEGGQNLLNLINDILDLSKVEAGKLKVSNDIVAVETLVTYLEKTFRHMAKEKSLAFAVEVDAATPTRFVSDIGRIEQILTNLAGNAIKFTEHGSIVLRIEVAAACAVPGCTKVSSGGLLAFSVTDTGMGIPADKIDVIFQVFEQIDGRPTRKHGGSGLGLSIAQNLANLLGGCIGVNSTPGMGSTFTLYLPVDAAEQMATQTGSDPAVAPSQQATGLRDDRATTQVGDDSILVVEDDLAFAAIVAGLVKKQGCRLLHAADGLEGLMLAERFLPRGIILDEMLPSLEGHEIVARLRQSPATRSIPVHFISALNVVEGLGAQGVIGCLTKPVSRDQIIQVIERLERAGLKQNCHLLVVAAVGEAEGIATHFRPRMKAVTVVHSVSAGLDRLREANIDLLILDPALPGEDGVALLEHAENLPPAIVYSSMELLPEQLLRLREYTDSIVIESEHSLERLTEEVVGFLHNVAGQGDTNKIPAPKAETITRFDGRTILVVDDDMRNLFALSKVLRGRGFHVLMAKNGVRALEQAENSQNIDAILMDIMMPEMDGYETMRRLRQMPAYQTLPIIAVTALAMDSDRQKCLDAGASDYLTKPVDTVHLFALLGSLLGD